MAIFIPSGVQNIFREDIAKLKKCGMRKTIGMVK